MSTPNPTLTLEAAYDFCREVARREAKNFYYSFRVLPKAKSDAMCAVYAFMRRADDIADDESRPMVERRAEMSAWLASWRASQSGAGTEDPVFLAVRDAQQRFGIADALMEDLVRGTSMDLEPEQPGVLRATVAEGAGERVLRVYESFDDLYRYCYLVASVVGLVCIRIFGYKDPAAEKLAERTGIAFQLTNILRDVQEDAELGRVYLPATMLTEFRVSYADVLSMASGRALQGNEHALLSALSVQAWEYYASARELLPLIEPDSRAALWVLVEIYSRLLQRIDRQGGDVFRGRISVPTHEKLITLLRGGAMSLRARGA